MSDSFEERMPAYLHLPIQVMWFDTNEITFLAMLYLCCSLLGGWAWLLLFMLPYPILTYKRRQPRGFFTHILYKVGFLTFTGYPESAADHFRE